LKKINFGGATLLDVIGTDEGRRRVSPLLLFLLRLGTMIVTKVKVDVSYRDMFND
jgi:hypothetical protein